MKRTPVWHTEQPRDDTGRYVVCHGRVPTGCSRSTVVAALAGRRLGGRTLAGQTRTDLVLAGPALAGRCVARAPRGCLLAGGCADRVTPGSSSGGCAAVISRGRALTGRDFIACWGMSPAFFGRAFSSSASLLHALPRRLERSHTADETYSGTPIKLAHSTSSTHLKPPLSSQLADRTPPR